MWSEITKKFEISLNSCTRRNYLKGGYLLGYPRYVLALVINVWKSRASRFLIQIDYGTLRLWIVPQLLKVAPAEMEEIGRDSGPNKR